MENINFRPLKASEVEARIGEIAGDSVEVLLYKTARVDANLLDEVVGNANWQSELKDTVRPDGTIRTHCSIAIYIDGRGWVSKADVGGDLRGLSEDKAAASDAFKRAGFKWGIGRELYTVPHISAPKSAFNIEQSAGGNYFFTRDKLEVTQYIVIDNTVKAFQLYNKTLQCVVYNYDDRTDEEAEKTGGRFGLSYQPKGKEQLVNAPIVAEEATDTAPKKRGRKPKAEKASETEAVTNTETADGEKSSEEELTLEQAKNIELTDGIAKGHTLGDVAEKAPNLLDRIKESSNNTTTIKAIEIIKAQYVKN